MQLGISSLLMAMVCSQAPTTSYQTNNFIVYADDAEVARQVGDAAEQHRTRLAKLWHNDKLADWAFPCRINVSVNQTRPEGVTEISFSESKVLFHRLDVKGPLPTILKGPLPHEVAHVLFAHHFGVQPPRWADEGGAIVSEGETQERCTTRSCAELSPTADSFLSASFWTCGTIRAMSPVCTPRGIRSLVSWLSPRGTRHF